MKLRTRKINMEIRELYLLRNLFENIKNNTDDEIIITLCNLGYNHISMVVADINAEEGESNG